MAFRETCAMEERIKTLSDYDTGAVSVSCACSPPSMPCGRGYPLLRCFRKGRALSRSSPGHGAFVLKLQAGGAPPLLQALARFGHCLLSLAKAKSAK